MATVIGMDAGRLVSRMGEAASRFLAALSTDQRAKALLDFDDQQERTRWFYTPVRRQGLPLVEMDRPQQRLAHQLLASGLSRTAYFTASTIMGIENTLDAIEGWIFQETRETNPERAASNYGRDPLMFYVSVFGEPDARKPWGWRFEGHHISINYTIVDGRIVAPTPTFFGSNPAETPLGGIGTLRPLGGVEDLGRELIHALDDERRAIALISPVAPPDIVTGNRAQVVEGATPLATPTLFGWEKTEEERDVLPERWRELGYSHDRQEETSYTSHPKGLAASAMSAYQREMLDALVREYIGRMPDEIAEIETARLTGERLMDVHFAWAGGVERRQPHYYRLQNARFLVEYDNTQDGANHVHTVWRDPRNDFGAGLLARHYAESHGRT